MVIFSNALFYNLTRSILLRYEVVKYSLGIANSKICDQTTPSGMVLITGRCGIFIDQA